MERIREHSGIHDRTNGGNGASSHKDNEKRADLVLASVARRSDEPCPVWVPMGRPRARTLCSGLCDNVVVLSGSRVTVKGVGAGSGWSARYARRLAQIAGTGAGAPAKQRENASQRGPGAEKELEGNSPRWSRRRVQNPVRRNLLSRVLRKVRCTAVEILGCSVLLSGRETVEGCATCREAGPIRPHLAPSPPTLRVSLSSGFKDRKEKDVSESAWSALQPESASWWFRTSRPRDVGDDTLSRAAKQV